jgi:hypothetical protein
MVSELSVNLRPSSYGNVIRVCDLPNGRVMYNVVDSEVHKAGKLSIPADEVDKFESSYTQILDSAPKIQAYVDANSSESSIRKRRNIARGIIAASGIIGAGIPLMILKKSTSVTKKILGAVAGVVTGLSAGFVASLSVTTPPGSIEFAKATRELSKLDIKPVLDEQA